MPGLSRRTLFRKEEPRDGGVCTMLWPSDDERLGGVLAASVAESSAGVSLVRVFLSLTLLLLPPETGIGSGTCATEATGSGAGSGSQADDNEGFSSPSSCPTPSTSNGEAFELLKASVSAHRCGGEGGGDGGGFQAGS